MMQIASINSGSNGNCYYVAKGHDAVLIDAGLACGEIEKRMQRLGLLMENVKAVFVSHEHSDHISGIPLLAKKYKLPVYVTDSTYRQGDLKVERTLTRTFQSFNPVTVGDLTITGFPKQHDACDPHSFIISSGGINIGVLTDIGTACEHVIGHFRQCHAAFLEANYDETLLTNGRYPYFLKNRIRSNKGHLSNTQALELFTRHRPSFMTHLLLSHLSRDNNHPDIVHALFQPHAKNTKVIVASRDKESPVYFISGQPASKPVLSFTPRPEQLSLF